MKHVLLLLAKGFEEYEASVFTDVLGWSRACGDIPVKVTTAGRHSNIKCAWNFTVVPEIMVEHVNVEDYDALAIPGGFEEAGFYEDAYHESFQRLIQDFNDKEKLFASVCVGALPIGKSGILLGRKATTYHLNGGIGKRQRQLAAFGVDVQDKHVVMDGNVITSSSPATALEVAFLLLEKLTSVENCRKVKEGMGFGGR